VHTQNSKKSIKTQRGRVNAVAFLCVRRWRRQCHQRCGEFILLNSPFSKPFICRFFFDADV